jgi:hypothetical protein
MNSLKRKALRSFLSLLLLTSVLLVVSPFANAAHVQLPNGVWRVYLSREVPVITQRTPVWCWAASLSAVFGFLQHPVDQTRIVARYFPPPGITTGPPWVMRDALNTTWIDDAGHTFRVSSPITNFYPPAGPMQVTNVDIIRALDNEVSVFYGDSTHAMVLVQTDYIIGPTGMPVILGGGAIDPYPNPATGVAWGFRPLQPNEMQGFFAAIPRITE